MNINFINTLIAGTAVAILIGGMQVLGCCCWPVDIVLLIAAGALAVHLSAATIRDQNDALITGGVAGLIGGLLGGLFYAVMSILMQLLFGTISFLGTDDPNAVITGTGITTISSGIGTFVCCLPTFVVAGIVLGAIGGLLYMSIRK